MPALNTNNLKKLHTEFKDNLVLTLLQEPVGFNMIYSAIAPGMALPRYDRSNPTGSQEIQQRVKTVIAINSV
jgi:hypothetical protein